MLANNLTLDDEEAVQEDLRQLEAEAVRLVIVRLIFWSLTCLSSLAL